MFKKKNIYDRLIALMHTPATTIERRMALEQQQPPEE